MLEHAPRSVEMPQVARTGFLQRCVSPEATCLIAICILDLMTTLFWVARGMASEGNPLLAYYLHHGVVQFIVAKYFMSLPAIVVAEWYRPRNPRLIRGVMRFVIAAYLCIYLVGVAGQFRHYLDPGSGFLLG